MNLIAHLKDVLQGKTSILHPRSSNWMAWRQVHISKECASCGGTEKLELHHIAPFHDHPELELDTTNVITLCESSTNCHLFVGHLKSWTSYNPAVRSDAAIWKQKIIDRPQATLGV